MPILAKEPNVYPDELFALITSPGVDGQRWWVAYTMARHEKKLIRQLRVQRVAHFCPFYRREWFSPGGRRREAYLPLFPGYVFFFGDTAAYEAAWKSGCLSRVLVPPDQLEVHTQLWQLYEAEKRGARLVPEPRLEKGRRVRVVSGQFMGFEGTIIYRANRCRLVLAIDFLQRGASLELSEWAVEPIETST